MRQRFQRKEFLYQNLFTGQRYDSCRQADADKEYKALGQHAQQRGGGGGYGVIQRVKALGAAAAFLSGAGPTIMSLWLAPPPPEAALDTALAGLAWQWKAKSLSVVDHGVRVEDA